MLFPRLLSVVLSTIWTLSEEVQDQQCFDDCICCIDEVCGPGLQLNNCTYTCRGPCVQWNSYNNCSLCIMGKYGLTCQDDCSVGCKDNTCSVDNGQCICSQNFTGGNCMECADGKFGPFFVCMGSYTNDNITGASCDTCITSNYGELCDMTCMKNCKNHICGRYSGNCSKRCIEHFAGRFGQFCDLNCSARCKFEETPENTTCEKSDGKCYGCIDGFFGPTCNDTCSSLCIGRVCRQDDGVCTNGCEGHQTQPECILSGRITGQTEKRQDPAGPISWLAAIIAGVTVVFILSVIFRRRVRKHPHRNKSVDSGTLSSDRSFEGVETVKDAPTVDSKHANVIDIRAAGAVLVDETNDLELDDAAAYYNCNTVNMNVRVADLFSYVTKDNFDIFEKEFENLPTPDDLSTSCKIAKKPENSSSNRYDGIYPFEHSRVTIPGQTKFYINACYIDGYNRSKAYIASFGPTIKHTARFKTFWKMVWHEKSDIIVMLTKLREGSIMKCEQYWPEIETGESYGHIKVKCRSTEEFADYTVRSFTVSKGKEHRNLTQLHFKAWPDQGVPSEVTSLVEFRQRVKAAPVVLGGPVVVHCSAGIGRTGTYIALDILSEQGKAEHSVNIFNCVSKMRRQKVFIVQTVEQCIFLHKALVHTLLFGSDSQTVEEITSLAFDAGGTFMHMFQTLTHEIDFEREDEISAREENRRNNADTFRRHSDIPGHRDRARLYLHRNSGSHDYINAVFISSFKFKDLFIAAQTPQSGTLEDFLCMIYQQNTSCIVALEGPIQLSKKHDIGIYLPTVNETYKCGDFTLTSLESENKPQYTITKITIKRTDKGKEKNVYHFQYTRWGNGRKLPDSPGDFVQFVKDVEKYVKQQEAYMTHVIVHCLNGNEKSGLFCVVYTLLEKLEAEGQISVVNVVRKVRAPRKLSITSVEQLKFCYQCAAAYSESNHTYTNYAVTSN